MGFQGFKVFDRGWRQQRAQARGRADKMTRGRAEQILRSHGATKQELADPAGDALKKRWRAIARKLHPDLPGAPANATQQLGLVNTAYTLLRDGASPRRSQPESGFRPERRTHAPVGDPRRFYEQLRAGSRSAPEPFSRAQVLAFLQEVVAQGYNRMQWGEVADSLPWFATSRGYFGKVTKIRTLKGDKFDPGVIQLLVAGAIGKHQGQAGLLGLEYNDSIVYMVPGLGPNGTAGLIWAIPTAIRLGGPLGSGYKVEWGSIRWSRATPPKKKRGDVGPGGKNLWNPAMARRFLRGAGLQPVSRAERQQPWSTEKANPRRIIVMKTQLKGTGFAEFGTPYGDVTKTALEAAVAQVKAWRPAAPSAEAGTWTRERTERWLLDHGWSRKPLDSFERQKDKVTWGYKDLWYPELTTSRYGLGEPQLAKFKWGEVTEALLQRYQRKVEHELKMRDEARGG